MTILNQNQQSSINQSVTRKPVLKWSFSLSALFEKIKRHGYTGIRLGDQGQTDIPVIMDR